MANELRFQHFIESTSDGLVFACARDRYGHIHNFLINRQAGVVLTQDRQRFTQTDPELAAFVVENFERKTAVSYLTRSIALN